MKGKKECFGKKKKMVFQNHCKRRVKLWNMKLGCGCSQQIKMNDRVSHKSLSFRREKEWARITDFLSQIPKVETWSCAKIAVFFPKKTDFHVGDPRTAILTSQWKS